MAESIALPDPNHLIPPLLACLPLAFTSSRPPPALLSLVTPIIRQRLQVLGNSSSSQHWLSRLCWGQTNAEKLQEIVERGTFEPHPSSGEIELGEIYPTTFKRFDENTLHAQLLLKDWDLVAIYLWCVEGAASSSWKLAELLPYDTSTQYESRWVPSIDLANALAASESMSARNHEDSTSRERNTSQPSEDDDYWARYAKMSTETSDNADGWPLSNGATSPPRDTKGNHYDRYSQVQPMMDSHDPYEQSAEGIDSSIQGDVLDGMLQQLQMGRVPPPPPESVSSRASSVGPGIVGRLERKADDQSSARVAVRQHIASSMKSLYRLAMTTGMERDEFNDLVERELQTNELVDF